MKKIIAAALSILLGAFGYTIVDKALEDRVATLESEVVELRENISWYHNENFDSKQIVEEIKIGRELKKQSTSKSEFIFRNFGDGKLVCFESNWMETQYMSYPYSFSEHVLRIDSSNVTVTSIEDDKICVTINCSGHIDSIFSGKEVKINWGLFNYGSNSQEITKAEINSDGTFEYQETRSFYHNPASSLWYVPTYSIYGVSINNSYETPGTN